MAEAFKNLIHAGLVHDTARALARVTPAFDAAAFTRRASAGLEALELKARAMQLADALDRTLPAGVAGAAEPLEAALAPLDEQGRPVAGQGLQGWVLWSAGELVSRRALAHPDELPRALQALHAITQRFTAEFAIRPLLRDHPDRVWPTLLAWARDPSPAVRRLASEGSRPRLPWGLRLQASVADPSPAWPILLALQDDPDEVVRRSVANHLNDIAKDHPDLLADWLHSHLPGASPARRSLLRHASRSLIKQGHPATLAAWGLGERFDGSVTLSLSPSGVPFGGTLDITLEVCAGPSPKTTLVIDYAIEHVGAHGRRSPKVFKGWNLQLRPGETRLLTRQHSLRPISTRRYYPGPHPLSVQINGQTVTSAEFELLAPVR